jgi:hypothetical protein
VSGFGQRPQTVDIRNMSRVGELARFACAIPVASQTAGFGGIGRSGTLC